MRTMSECERLLSDDDAVLRQVLCPVSCFRVWLVPYLELAEATGMEVGQCPMLLSLWSSRASGSRELTILSAVQSFVVSRENTNTLAPWQSELPGHFPAAPQVPFSGAETLKVCSSRTRHGAPSKPLPTACSRFPREHSSSVATYRQIQYSNCDNNCVDCGLQPERIVRHALGIPN